jgi:hypothetical protein
MPLLADGTSLSIPGGAAVDLGLLLRWLAHRVPVVVDEKPKRAADVTFEPRSQLQSESLERCPGKVLCVSHAHVESITLIGRQLSPDRVEQGGAKVRTSEL